MNAPQLTPADHLYKAARDLVPGLRERSQETASLGQLPEATVAAMQQAGFFRIMQPARYGGFELDPEVFFKVQMILAEGCMSTAWYWAWSLFTTGSWPCSMIGHNRMSGARTTPHSSPPLTCP